MRTAALIGYFILPALAFLTLGAWKDGFRLSVADVPSFLPNYLVFAAPQIVWVILTLVLRLTAPVFHAGFIGATLTLLGMHVRFECCVDNQGGLGWFFYYWPFALVATFAFAAFVGAWKNRIPDSSAP